MTAVHPQFSLVIDGNVNVVTKASTANLTLTGINGGAIVVVDFRRGKSDKDR